MKELKKRVGVGLSIENYKSLNSAYQKAVRNGKKGDDVITWEGNELLVSYLFYMLEYFETVKEMKDYAVKHKITRKRV